MDSTSEGQEEETKKDKKMMYDYVDMRNSYNRGFWIGALSGVMSSFLVCLLVGLFVSN